MSLDVSFLTWNIYRGADISPLIDPTPAAVTQVFRQFLATNFPVRAKAIAREIASKKPDLIGLQEAEKWVLEIPTFSIVTYDLIEILLDALREIGLHYEVAALLENPNALSQGLHDSNGNKISFLNRNAILIRKDHGLKVINRQVSHFKTMFDGFLRGWCAVDVKVDGHVFRMITTHLEPLNPPTRVGQAQELIDGPANTDLPVIITGDLNSTPNSPPYNILITNGFRDVWNAVGEGLGLTCCQGADLLNAVSSLIIRIDYILFKNGWKPKEAELVGEEQSDRTRTGLWPSDHAGVSASLRLKVHHDHHHDESSDESSEHHHHHPHHKESRDESSD
ncbi:endonuclease/exonuclease/phosphatase family protein [Neobacillus drentensis]|uniref:endonuclease/exonuclease/phosphatase family protein n=1 Tax=Neobacillus drentensis TaxID=220684 RepID=UPI0028544A9D|nr:endonuclease/exonuclease/phosphatase family protein [Neobacillus drentensis]MDR7236490.1 endonuclease/exonuclease/phosphatase family metal-dependent hydrolase [Neobacillus drentensis]